MYAYYKTKEALPTYCKPGYDHCKMSTSGFFLLHHNINHISYYYLLYSKVGAFVYQILPWYLLTLHPRVRPIFVLVMTICCVLRTVEQTNIPYIQEVNNLYIFTCVKSFFSLHIRKHLINVGPS